MVKKSLKKAAPKKAVTRPKKAVTRPKKAAPKKVAARPKKAVTRPKKAAPKKAAARPKKAVTKKVVTRLKRATPKKAAARRVAPKRAAAKRTAPKRAAAKRTARRPAEKPTKKPIIRSAAPTFSSSAASDVSAIKGELGPPAKAYSHVHPHGADLIVIYPPLGDRAGDRSRMITDLDRLSTLPLSLRWWARAGISVMVDQTENEEDYHKKGKLWQKDIYSSPRPLSEPGMALTALWGDGGIISRNENNILGHLLIELSITPNGGRPNR
jgi:hypothetical protein